MRCAPSRADPRSPVPGPRSLYDPPVTYNFDPDRWFENQQRALDERRARGEIDEAGYKAALADLEAQYDRMQDRLNKAFDLGSRGTRDTPA